jgi:hypothetical protein
VRRVVAILFEVLDTLLLLLNETLTFFGMVDRKCKVALCTFVGHAYFFT